MEKSIWINLTRLFYDIFFQQMVCYFINFWENKVIYCQYFAYRNLFSDFKQIFIRISKFSFIILHKMKEFFSDRQSKLG